MPNTSLALTLGAAALAAVAGELRRRTGSRVVGGGIARKIPLPRQLSLLVDYLTMSDAEKGREVANFEREVFLGWMERVSTLEPGDWHHQIRTLEPILPLKVSKLVRAAKRDAYGDAWDALVDALPDTVFDAWFKDDAVRNETAGDPYAPSFLTMKFRHVLPRGWLVHFTDDPGNIARHGFKGGIDRVEHLALTTHLRSQRMEDRPGYVFAYAPDDVGRWAMDRGRPKYGRHAVLFRAPAVYVHHYGDDENQAITWGPLAQDILRIHFDRNEWWLEHPNLDKRLVHGEDVTDLTSWLDTHFDQYARLLLPRKPPHRKMKGAANRRHRAHA